MKSLLYLKLNHLLAAKMEITHLMCQTASIFQCCLFLYLIIDSQSVLYYMYPRASSLYLRASISLHSKCDSFIFNIIVNLNFMKRNWGLTNASWKASFLSKHHRYKHIFLSMYYNHIGLYKKMVLSDLYLQKIA